ncbi:MAG: hypothetical protein HQL98_02960 [Magnetococcales bacterium]|nr:hypothetical protein [Magnetococcales bacterium]
MIHGSQGSRSPEAMSRVGTFFVATRADWLAWLDSVDAQTPARATVTERQLGRGWTLRRGKIAGRMY